MLAILLSLLSIQPPIVLYDFATASDLNEWKIVNDGVMGGRSSGEFTQTKDGNGQFKGKVSLQNNGGFTSVRYAFETKKIEGAKTVKIRLKGDGKSYQFRVKEQSTDQVAFKYEFQTTGAWELIEIPLAEMTPTYRGMRPNQPNYTAKMLSEIGFLIANKKEEQFELLIEKIWLE